MANSCPSSLRKLSSNKVLISALSSLRLSKQTLVSFQRDQKLNGLALYELCQRRHVAPLPLGDWMKLRLFVQDYEEVNEAPTPRKKRRSGSSSPGSKKQRKEGMSEFLSFFAFIEKNMPLQSCGRSKQNCNS